MRRLLTVAVVALILVGVEVATGAGSLAADRLWTGLSDLLAGREAVTSTERLVAGCALIVSGAALGWGLLWVDRVAERIAVHGSRCPTCSHETVRVRRRTRHRILSRILAAEVTRRQCGRCGWKGLAA